MKRTAEIILTVIGIIFYLLVAAIGGLLATLTTNQEFAEGFESEFQMSADESINATELIDMIGAGGIALLIISLVCIVFGIVAAIMFKKNAYPKTMGIIMIVLAIICSFISFGLAILPGVFYLIAGTVALVKKTVTIPENTTTINHV